MKFKLTVVLAFLSIVACERSQKRALSDDYVTPSAAALRGLWMNEVAWVDYRNEERAPDRCYPYRANRDLHNPENPRLLQVDHEMKVYTYTPGALVGGGAISSGRLLGEVYPNGRFVPHIGLHERNGTQTGLMLLGGNSELYLMDMPSPFKEISSVKRVFTSGHESQKFTRVTEADAQAYGRRLKECEGEAAPTVKSEPLVDVQQGAIVP